MGWLPDKRSDAFWFAVAPITTGPTFLYASAGYVSGEYPLGKPDWRANARNALIWTGAAGGAYTWNYFMSPHNATFMSGSSAWKTALHIGGVPLAVAVATVAVGVGYVATADVHGGTAGMAPGGVGPTEALGFDQGVRDLFGWLGF